jgi:hypothetical protein
MTEEVPLLVLLRSTVVVAPVAGVVEENVALPHLHAIGDVVTLDDGPVVHLVGDVDDDSLAEEAVERYRRESAPPDTMCISLSKGVPERSGSSKSCDTIPFVACRWKYDSLGDG